MIATTRDVRRPLASTGGNCLPRSAGGHTATGGPAASGCAPPARTPGTVGRCKVSGDSTGPIPLALIATGWAAMARKESNGCLAWMVLIAGALA
jgi:hypothetical protein